MCRKSKMSMLKVLKLSERKMSIAGETTATPALRHHTCGWAMDRCIVGCPVDSFRVLSDGARWLPCVYGIESKLVFPTRPNSNTKYGARENIRIEHQAFLFRLRFSFAATSYNLPGFRLPKFFRCRRYPASLLKLLSASFVRHRYAGAAHE
jgi:hypothetical protein